MVLAAATAAVSTVTAALASARALTQGLPQLRIADIDLAPRWLELVREGSIAATANIGDGRQVEYGVRETSSCGVLQEWAIGDAALEKALADGSGRVTIHSADGYCAQLQLIRSLRPPPTPSLSSLPPYDRQTDSFVTGPLRLQIRTRVASIDVHQNGRMWDAYHNISPCDPRGHFLLLPTIDREENWRKQALTAADCRDFWWMAQHAEGAPGLATSKAGGVADEAVSGGAMDALLLCFNGVRAGASQNHVHCHAWPAPPVGCAQGMRYAVEGAHPAAMREVLNLRDSVEVSMLDYPVACIRLRPLRPSKNNDGDTGDSDDPDFIGGSALAALVHAIEAAQLAHNVVALRGRVFVFVRLAHMERSASFPRLKLGSSEMAGCFHCQAADELEQASSPGAIAAALESVSAPHDEVWSMLLQTMETLQAASLG